MGDSNDKGIVSRLDWLARGAVGAVFAMNVWCALSFILDPGSFAGAYELAGASGEAAVRGYGVVFLMWNATYPLVLARPSAHRQLFAAVLVQQVIGLVGESAIALTLPAGHDVLLASVERFALFDGAGLVLMAVAFALLVRASRNGVSNGG